VYYSDVLLTKIVLYKIIIITLHKLTIIFFYGSSARIGGASLIAGITKIAQRVSELARQQSNDEELLLTEAPENFLDPIMSTLMVDPVILPSSKMNVDRSTIARYIVH